VYDLSFRTNWTAKYALLSNHRLLIFKNSNDPSPWRSIYLSSSMTVVGEGALGLTLDHLLEREKITLKLNSQDERDEWLKAILRIVADAQKVVELARLEAERLKEEAMMKPIYKPITQLGSFGSNSGAGGSLGSGAQGSGTGTPPVKKERLKLTDLAEESAAPPPPPAPTSLLDFDLPAALLPPEWQQGEASFVLTFGSGAAGQLGHRNKDDALKPQVLDALKSKPVRCVSGGGSHAALVTEQGHVYVMGSGPLGLGERMQESKSPYLVTSLLATPVRSVSCGKTHTLALSTTGLVYSWGQNTHGQLGLGHKNVAFYPTVIETLRPTPVHSISAGGEHSACVTTERQLYTWGNNASGQLGLGSTETHAVPILNSNLLLKQIHLASVSAGSDFTLTLSSAGVVYACGNNDHGMLGHGDRAKRSLFVEVTYFTQKGLRVGQISAGATHSVALALNEKTEPLVYTFGAAVANGFREAQVTPILVAALTNTRVVSTGSASSHTLTLNSAGRPFAFGHNSFGELGNGAAGVEALIKIRLASTVCVASAAAGSAFSLLLCRGDAPAHVLPGVAPEVIPGPPKETNSTEIKQALGLQSGEQSAGGPDFNSAIDQIAKLLMMEGNFEAMMQQQSGSSSSAAAAAPKQPTVVVQPGQIDLVKMKSVEHMKLQDLPKPSAPAPKAEKPIVVTSTATKPPPAEPLEVDEVVGAAVIAPVAPRQSTVVRPSSNTVFTRAPSASIVQPFKFTAAATAAVPAPAAATAPVTLPAAAAPKIAAAYTPAPAASTVASAASPPAGGQTVAQKIAALKAASFTPQVPGVAPVYRPAAAAATTTAAPAPAPAAAAVPTPTPVSPPSTISPPAAVASPSVTSPSESGGGIEKKKKERIPLPAGWKKVKDEASGRSYYFHLASKITTWKRPKPESAVNVEGDVPPPPPPAPEDDVPPPAPEEDGPPPPPAE
jgi:hypothetical protein